MTQTPESQLKVSVHDFFFEKGLYESIKISDFEEDIFNGEVDGYSHINNIDTTYSIKQGSNKLILSENEVWSNTYAHKFGGFITIELKCKRKENDTLYFYLLINDTTINKIGQYPSLADLQFSELGRKYDKVLPTEDLKNFKKAILLHSHGAGAGSFVYLRRIFENLIFETYQNHKSNISVIESDFNKLRMAEKVETIEGFLPSSLVRMKTIYGILSKGVHELSEEECMKYFGALKVSIELILDEKIEINLKAAKDKKAELEIQKITQQLS